MNTRRSRSTTTAAWLLGVLAGVSLASPAAADDLPIQPEAKPSQSEPAVKTAPASEAAPASELTAADLKALSALMSRVDRGKAHLDRSRKLDAPALRLAALGKAALTLDRVRRDARVRDGEAFEALAEQAGALLLNALNGATFMHIERGDLRRARTDNERALDVDRRDAAAVALMREIADAEAMLAPPPRPQPVAAVATDEAKTDDTCSHCDAHTHYYDDYGYRRVVILGIGDRSLVGTYHGFAGYGRDRHGRSRGSLSYRRSRGNSTWRARIDHGNAFGVASRGFGASRGLESGAAIGTPAQRSGGEGGSVGIPTSGMGPLVVQQRP